MSQTNVIPLSAAAYTTATARSAAYDAVQRGDFKTASRMYQLAADLYPANNVSKLAAKDKQDLLDLARVYSPIAE